MGIPLRMIKIDGTLLSVRKAYIMACEKISDVKVSAPSSGSQHSLSDTGATATVTPSVPLLVPLLTTCTNTLLDSVTETTIEMSIDSERRKSNSNIPSNALEALCQQHGVSRDVLSQVNYLQHLLNGVRYFCC